MSDTTAAPGTDPTIERIGRHMTAGRCHDGSWLVESRNNTILGSIEWNPDWRKHEFVPDSETAFTADCLAPMAAFLAKLDLAKAVRP